MGFGWIGSAADLSSIEGETNVLPDDNGGFDQGDPGLNIERSARNIIDMIDANGFMILDLFAHIMVFVGGFWLVWQCS